jgi:phosphopantetheinyl transferase (holo-ACP synthase)
MNHFANKRFASKAVCAVLQGYNNNISWQNIEKKEKMQKQLLKKTALKNK